MRNKKLWAKESLKRYKAMVSSKVRGKSAAGVLKNIRAKFRENCIKSTRKSKTTLTAEQIAQLADKGKDVSKHFTNQGKLMPAIRRVNVDFAENMLKELDGLVREMNVSRQAVIKSIIRQGLDQHYLAKKKRHHLTAH